MKTIIFLIAIVCSSKAFSLQFEDIETSEERVYIEGGRDAKKSEAPWQVALFVAHTDKPGYHFECGGVLIGSRTVVTAAHCCDTEYLNSRSMNVTDDYVIKYGGLIKGELPFHNKVIGKIIHPNWNFTITKDDYCIMHLNESVRQTEGVKIIKLADQVPKPGTLAHATGWGLNHTADTQRLQFLSMSVVSLEECRRAWATLKVPPGYPLIPLVTDDKVCAISKDKKSNITGGDSGGPLVVENKLVGLVSMAAYVNGSALPSAFTGVFKEKSWILKNII